MAEALNTLMVVRADDPAGLTSTFTTSRALQVIDLMFINVNGGAGTLAVQNAGVDVVAALDPGDTVGEFIRSGLVVAGQKDVTAGAAITFVASAVTLSYDAYLTVFPTPGVTG